MQNPDEIPVNTLAETENYIVWASEEPDGETTFHLELEGVTVHFFREEWQEFLELVNQLPNTNTSQAAGGSKDKKRRNG